MADTNKQVYVNVYIDSMGLDKMTGDFEKLTHPPGFEAIGRFEKTLAEAFVAVKAHVHVLTGGLLASGVTATSFDGGIWHGQIDFARDPGIFELARGDKPSAMHPDGGHFFFDAAEPFEDEWKRDMLLYFEDALGPSL